MEFRIDRLEQDTEVTTEDGNRVRILCTDAGGSFPIVALINELEPVQIDPDGWIRGRKQRVIIRDKCQYIVLVSDSARTFSVYTGLLFDTYEQAKALMEKAREDHKNKILRGPPMRFKIAKVVS